MTRVWWPRCWCTASMRFSHSTRRTLRASRRSRFSIRRGRVDRHAVAVRARPFWPGGLGFVLSYWQLPVKSQETKFRKEQQGHPNRSDPATPILAPYVCDDACDTVDNEAGLQREPRKCEGGNPTPVPVLEERRNDNDSQHQDGRQKRNRGEQRCPFLFQYPFENHAVLPSAWSLTGCPIVCHRPLNENRATPPPHPRAAPQCGRLSPKPRHPDSAACRLLTGTGFPIPRTYSARKYPG